MCAKYGAFDKMHNRFAALVWFNMLLKCVGRQIFTNSFKRFLKYFDRFCYAVSLGQDVVYLTAGYQRFNANTREYLVVSHPLADQGICQRGRGRPYYNRGKKFLGIKQHVKINSLSAKQLGAAPHESANVIGDEVIYR